MQRRRALLIGIKTYQHAPDLSGCHHDVTAMAEVLDLFGFEIEKVFDPDRHTLDAHLDRFLDATEPGDIALFFFSGHGSFLLDPETGKRYESLVPADSGRGSLPNLDFFDLELQSWQRKMEAAGAHLTMIFDACHSGHVTRDGDGRQIADDPEPSPSLLERLRELDQHQPSVTISSSSSPSSSSPSSSSSIVLAACREFELAGEYLAPKRELRRESSLRSLPAARFLGVTFGAFTFHLHHALAAAFETGENTTWGAVIRRVARRVRRHRRRQNPVLHGNPDLPIFALDGLERTPFLRLTEVDGETVTLSGGAAHGVDVGSRWQVRTRTASHPEQGTRVAEIEVRSVSSAQARAVVVNLAPGASAKPTQRAFLLHPSVQTEALKLGFDASVDPSLLRILATEIERQPRLTTAVSNTADSNTADRDFEVLLRRSGDHLQALGRSGALAVRPRQTTPEAIRALISDLDQLARFESLLEIEPPPDDPLASRIRFEAATAKAWDQPFIPTTELTFEQGQEVEFRIVNEHDAPVWLNLLHFEHQGRIKRLLPDPRRLADPPAGIRLESGQELRLPGDRWGQRAQGRGYKQQLPDGFPWGLDADLDAVCPSILRLFVTLKPADFSFLDQQGVRQTFGHPLEAFLAARMNSPRRNENGNPNAKPWTVIDLELAIHRTARRGAGPDPAPVDDRPAPSARRLVQAPASPSVPEPIHSDALDFELRIGERAIGDEQHYPIAVLRSPAGEVDAKIRFPQSDPHLRPYLANVRGSNPDADIEPWNEAPDLAQPLSSSEDELQDLGATLFETVFQDEILSAYRVSRDRARRTNQRLRLRLRIDAPELATLPWESLYDPSAGQFLALDPQTAVVRHPEVAIAIEQPPRPRPLRLLAMAALPRDQATLDSPTEQSSVAKALDHLIQNGDLELVWVEGETARDLENKLAEGPWHAFHFIGHGGWEDGEGHLVLADEHDHSHRLLARQLATLLARCPELRLVMLNSCEGARGSREALFSSTGTVLTRRGVPAVISMQFPISDRAAIEFARGFYTSLAAGKPVDEATDLARHSVDLALPSSTEWATPVLHLRLASGYLFAPNEDFTAREHDVVTVRGVERLTYDWDVASLWPPRLILTTSHHHRPRSELDLLAKVSVAWIRDRLTRSLDERAGLDPKIRNLNGSGNHNPADLLREGAQALVFLGELGAGQDIELLRLAHELIRQAESDARLPIPVLLPLAARAARAEAFEAWLLEALALQYQVPNQLGRGWIERGLILPLLDDLREIEAPHRQRFLAELEAFLERGGRFVLTSDTATFGDLKTPPAVDAILLVEPLADEQIFEHLDNEKALNALANALKQDSALRLEARSPLMLGFMAHMVRHVPAASLMAKRFESALERRRAVLKTFVEYRLGHEKIRPRERSKILTGLQWLAQGLKRQKDPIFLIEKLTPAWLSSKTRRLAHLISFQALFGLLAGFLLMEAWDLSLQVDPPDSEPRTRRVDWLLISMLWAIGAGLLGRRPPRFTALSRMQKRFALSLEVLAYSALWCLLWTLLWLGQGRVDTWRAAMQEPLILGSVLISLYTVRFGRFVPSRAAGGSARPATALSWSWRMAVLGGFLGASAGFLAWLLFIGTASKSWDFRLAHLRFYLPLCAGTGVLFSGLRRRFFGRPSRPNEGIRLAWRNALLASLFGFLFGATALALALEVRGFEGFPGLERSPEIAPWIILRAGLLTGGIAFLWYGFLDVLRHLVLRFFLAFEAPSPLSRFLDQAVHLRFLDRVGGGYMFLHRYLLDHFTPETTPDLNPENIEEPNASRR